MLTRLRSHVGHNIVGYIALVVALGGTGAYAASSIVGRDGTINGCFRAKGKAKGDLRVVPKGTRCKRGERAIAWNQQGKQGPEGKQGPPGSDAQFNGAAAGGDLTGSYPNPFVAPDAIGTSEVDDDSLTGSDVDEASLDESLLGVVMGSGRRLAVPQQILDVGDNDVPVISLPGIGSIVADCSGAPGSQGMTVTYKNVSGGPQAEVGQMSGHAGLTSVLTSGTILANDTTANFVFNPSASGTGRWLELQVASGETAADKTAATFHLAAITRAGESDGCSVYADAVG